MTHRDLNRPIVLVFAGHDPTGGAGLVADATTLLALGCHPLTICTVLTAQDTRDVSRFQLVDPEFIRHQLDLLLNDIQPAAIKTGLLANAQIVELVANLAHELAIPLVVDPVLASGAGTDLTTNDLIYAYREFLLPQTLLATPNRAEARRLSGHDQPDEVARVLLATGCQHLLVTTTDDGSGDQINHQYYNSGSTSSTAYHSVRLSGSFHGSGCTLAAAICAGISHGTAVEQAITNGLDYTARTLAQAYAIGQGQLIPQRLAD